MTRFIDAHPVLREQGPGCGPQPARAHCDAQLREHVTRVWEENYRVYGVRKVWRQLRREHGLRGVMRGSGVKTTTPVATLACPADRVNREFQAPTPKRLVARGHHVRRDLGRGRLRRVRHGRLCPTHRRVAGVERASHRPAARRA